MKNKDILEKIVDTTGFVKTYFKYEALKNKETKNQFAYVIDEIYWNPQGLVRIKGWGFDVGEGTYLNYEILKKQVKKISLQRFKREDVAEIYGLDKNLALGFQIEGELKNLSSLLLLLKNQKGVRFPISIEFGKKREIKTFIKNLKTQGVQEAIKERKSTRYPENQFQYHIDVIYWSPGGAVRINGWGINIDDKTPLDYEIENNLETTGIERFKRKDVNEAHGLSDDIKVGFTIEGVVKDLSAVSIIMKNNRNLTLSVPVECKKAGNLKSFLINAKKRGLNKAMELSKLSKYLDCTREESYARWIYKYEGENIGEIKKNIEQFKKNPKISIVTPVYNVEEEWLRRFIDSVLNQYYTNWELCIADDCSPSPHVRQILEEYTAKDTRIKVFYREENGHISEATNSAMTLITGEFVGFMDNDDELEPNALYEYVKVINEKEDAEFIYCDEDKLDIFEKRFDPFFKSSWNPQLMLGHNYITHFVVVKKSLLDEVGNLCSETNGSQDYDFILRATEKAKGIYHVPKILYHWRTIEGSAALNPKAKNYAYVAGKVALERAMKRRNEKSKVIITEYFGNYKIEYDHRETPLVSIVVPGAEIELIKHLKEMTDYDNIEIITDREEGRIIDGVKIMEISENCSQERALNLGEKQSEGEYVVFLNKNIRFENNQWLKELLNLGMRKETDVVGGKILSENGTVLNGGLSIIGNNEVFYSHAGDPKESLGYFYRLVSSQNVFAISYDFMLIKRAAFQKANGFNENLSFPLASIDLCMKVRRENEGVIFTPNAEGILSFGTNNQPEEKEWKKFNACWSPEAKEDKFTNENFIRLLRERKESEI